MGDKSHGENPFRQAISDILPLEDCPFYPPFLFPTPFLPENIHTPPQTFSGLLEVRFWGDLSEVVSHLPFGRPAMLARMVNIPDVPLPFGSGGEKDELASFQKGNTIIPILPGNS
ncbi:MAG: hypothetical protein ACFFCW_48965 [Candidatus Hodarchaeota archaeon]